jgi:hypothetical protein
MLQKDNVASRNRFRKQGRDDAEMSVYPSAAIGRRSKPVEARSVSRDNVMHSECNDNDGGDNDKTLWLKSMTINGIV